MLVMKRGKHRFFMQLISVTNKCVEILTKAGADVNVQNDQGFTALRSTAWNGDVKCMEVLTTAGADVNVCDPDGFTALIISTHEGHYGCVTSLIQKGS